MALTLNKIVHDLTVAHNWECLYLASEEQICKLIDQGKIDEDFFSRHQDYQEEMRCMMNGAAAEFG